MSAEETAPKEEISKVPSASQAEPKNDLTSKPELPEAPNKGENIRKALQAKIDQGYNLSDKSVYPKIYREIAQIENCSYSNVLQTAKSYLKKSNSNIIKTSQSDGSVVHVKTVTPDERPPPKAKPEEQKQANTLSRIIQTSLSEEQLNTMLQFESDMIELSFDNISTFLKSIGMPAPQQKKIQKMCHTIAMFNQKMDLAGKPEQKIDVGEKLLPWMIKLGAVGLFFQPIANKYLMGGKEKKDEIQKVNKSMRS